MPYPSSALYPGDDVLPGPIPPEPPPEPPPTLATDVARVSIRELPALRTSIIATTPGGRRYRWAGDDPDPANVPNGQSWSSTMPGGFENLDVTLPRQISRDYSDLERLTTLQIFDAAGSVVGEYRLERAPRTSGDRMSVSPGAVGWQAHLDDDKSARPLYIDRRLEKWQGPSRARQIVLVANSPVNGPSISSDAASGLPALKLDMSGVIEGINGYAEAYYDAGAGNLITKVYWAAVANKNTESDWLTQVFSATDVNNTSTALQHSIAYNSTAAATITLGTPRRVVELQLLTDPHADNAERWRQFTGVFVVGGTGVAITGTGGSAGVIASDVVEHAVTEWAPELSIGEIDASVFVIPQLAFDEWVTAGDIVKAATRFGLQDWAVWEDKRFWWHLRGAHGRNWRARVGSAQLQDAGPQMDRLYESVLVAYQDVDGSTRSVGPVGSGADVEDADLHDADPDNPANKSGIVRRAYLTAGTLTAAAATELGARFLEQHKEAATSGSARFVGHVEDDHGVLHPYHHVRAGDTVTFMDASDPSPRRIVRAAHDGDSHTCTVDLDSPPDSMDALLARLGVALAPLGL